MENPAVEDLDEDLHEDDDVEESGQAPPPPEPGQPPPADEEKGAGEDAQAGPVIPAGPVLLFAAQGAVVAGAGLWHVAGWPGLAAGAVTAAGATGWVISRRLRDRDRRPGARRRAAMPGPGRRASGSGGSRSSRASGGLGGGSTGGGSRRSRLSSPGRRHGGGSRGAGGGAFRRASSSKAGRKAGRKGRARTTAGAPPSFGQAGKPRRKGPGRAAVYRTTGAGRTAARRTAGAARRGVARLGRAAERSGRALRAAHWAARDGRSPRQAARAARRAAADTQPRGHLLRRLAVAGAVTVLGSAWAWIWQLLSGMAAEVRRSRRIQHQRRIRTTVDRPTTSRTDTTTTGKATVGNADSGYEQSALITALEEAAAALKAYHLPKEPGAMMQFRGDMARLPQVLGDLADGWRALADQCVDELPIDNSFAEFFEALGGVQDAMAEQSEDLVPEFDRLHPELVERLENPRVNEEMWDVGS